MCKSIKTSLTTFAITAVSFGIIWLLSSAPQYRFAVLFLFTISLMQLVDAALWVSVRNKLDITNLMISRYVILAVLIAEILVSYYGIRYYMGWSDRRYEAIMWVSIGIMIYRWLYIYDCKKTSVYPDGYLFWCTSHMTWYGKIIFLMLLIIPIIMGYPNMLLKWLLVGGITATFAVNFFNGTFGTRWCWSGNTLVPIILLVVLLERYKIIR